MNLSIFEFTFLMAGFQFTGFAAVAVYVLMDARRTFRHVASSSVRTLEQPAAQARTAEAQEPRRAA